jgi:N-acetylmuramoyl-L-alanine amidase
VIATPYPQVKEIGLFAIHPQAHILGHRDLPNVSKSCPCFDAQEEYKDI